MPSFVIYEKCDGCKGKDKTACMYICPNDLMVFDKDKMKAFNRAPDMCWECYNCVKICPQQAIDVRGYADFVPLGASVSCRCAVPRTSCGPSSSATAASNASSSPSAPLLKVRRFPTAASKMAPAISTAPLCSPSRPRWASRTLPTLKK